MATRQTNPRYANGHRRRQAAARIRARDTHCALCGAWIDPTLPYRMPGQHGRNCNNPSCQGCLPHPYRGEVDENIPVSRGGSPTALSNLVLLHRACNNWKSNRTLDEARRAYRTQGQPQPTQPDNASTATTQGRTTRAW